MNELIKVRDVTLKYDISSRALTYYEDMDLITSTRNDEYAYRMYDDDAVKRLEQILILRKLNISIKDIKRIFDTPGSAAVLEVLGKKTQNIDEEIGLLHELKGIIADFICKIERMNFADNADVKLLYDKAKEIETQFMNVEYIGKPTNIGRLVEITEKLDKQIPDVMVVKIPKFRAVTSGLTSWDEVMGSFDTWMSVQGDICEPIIFDGHDFLTGSEHGVEWLWRIRDEIGEEDVNPYTIREFDGGLYALAVSVDGDDDSHGKVRSKIIRWLETTNFIRDDDRTELGHMIYVDENIKKGLGYHQLNLYFPIKLDEAKLQN